MTCTYGFGKSNVNNCEMQNTFIPKLKKVLPIIGTLDIL